ncbi:MAG: Omp28-related outer membrane protein [Flavobacteriales bacterium]|nr:Omp28-related outer membrane protein [Flavobacteriales bacterium]
MRHTHIAILLSITVTMGCDKISEPYAAPGSDAVDTSDVVGRRVLLEDFTGFRCNNCPAATQVALQLQQIYGEDRLLIVGVHGMPFFSDPVPPAGDGYFDTDFQTPEANIYVNTFGITFLPTGMVSRREYNSSLTLGDASWGSAIDEIIGTPADVDVIFSSFQLDGTNTIQTTIDVPIIQDLAGDYNLTVYLTEDHVDDWQIDNQQSPPEVEHYDHRHVLRDNLNGAWGDPLVLGSASAGDTLSATFSHPLPANVIDPDHCALIAYVYNTANYEIIQVSEHRFQP